jgi:(S)-mandelate dehydrogenase
MTSFSVRKRLAKAHSIEDLRGLAYKALPKMVFDFVDGAAEAEETARANRSALDDVGIVPDPLRDVTERSTSVELFGRRSRMPIIIGPTGMNAAYWPRGDIALARAAAEFDIPFVMSWGANASMAEIREDRAAQHWFQINLPRGQELWKPILESVKSAGFEALEVTVDTPVPGRRLRDLHNQLALPMRWTPSKMAQLVRHPRWAYHMARQGTPEPANVKAAYTIAALHVSTSDLVSKLRNAAPTWDDLRHARDVWRGPLVIKGLTNPRDVSAAIDAGYDGIVVSNHGGRQLDGAVSTIAMLPEFVKEARGRIALLIDGGFRSGTDVLKALALGAAAVQIGRATVYGLAAGGQLGVERALEILLAQLDTAMALSGVTTIAQARALETRKQTRI